MILRGESKDGEVVIYRQSNLARAVSKDRQVAEKLENVKVNPTLYSLLEIAEALKVSLAVLVDF